MKYKNGEEFLNSLYDNMHMEEVVMHTAKKGDSPTEKISKYLERLERVHDKAITSNHKMEILKKFYYDKYIIKELPESYINLQKRILKERGYGKIDITEDMRKEMLLNVQKEQEYSLNMWIDYLTSDDAIYPIWFKYYAFRGMLKLNKFDKEQGKFGKRTKTTTEPYIELNREVLARVYDTIVKEIGNNEQIDETISKALENGESFKKLYEYYLTKTSYVDRGNNTDGIWIKYDQGSDYKPLWESLQGKNTGWCTAGEQTANTQLSNGDFYVYYTKDKEGKYTEPRIAIRMDGKNKIGEVRHKHHIFFGRNRMNVKNKIAEVRGVGKNQNLEGCMTDIALEKLNEFSDKDEYLKKVNDMKLLTEIDNKVNSNIELNVDELKFLYEIDYKIDGFGYATDPRIKEIKDKRNPKKDLAIIFNCKEENIGTKLSDFENNQIIYFYGDLKYDKETVTSNFKELRCIIGSAIFRSLISAKGLENLQSIGMHADFKKLVSAKGLEKLQSIGSDANFPSLTSAKGLEKLQSIGGSAIFSSLISAKGLNNLQSITEIAWFESLTSAEGLEKLQSIGEDADFDSLISTDGLDSLETVNGEDATKFKEEIDSRGSKKRWGKPR